MQNVAKQIRTAVKPIIQRSQHAPWSVPVNVDHPFASATSLSVAAGGVAHCTAGNWDYADGATKTYAWYRGATAISGATSSSYTFVAADIGANLTCHVIATNWKGASAPAISNALAVVA